VIPQRLAAAADTAFEVAAKAVDADLQQQREHGIYFTAVDMSRLPFLFASERWPGEIASSRGTFTLSGRHVCCDPFALQLTVVDVGGAAALEYGWDAARFEDGVAEYIHDLYVTLLRAALEHPGRALGSLDLLSPRARRAMVAQSAGRARAIRDESLVSLFEQQVAAAPDRIAVADARQELSYAALDAAANDVAHRLQRLGTPPEAMVGLLTDRSAETIAGLLGILKASAVAVPLDPAQPAERWRSTPAGAAIRALVGRAALSDDEQLPAVAVALNVPNAGPAVGAPAGAATAAYAIFTSGSSGQPNAVIVEQRAVVNLLSTLARLVYEPLGGALRVAVNAPLTFDASVKQWMQLLHGHTVCMVPEDVRTDMSAMLAWLAAQRVNVLDCTPAQLHLLLLAGLDHRALPHLEAVLVGGEAVDVALWTAIGKVPEIRFYNVYGPTECTVDSTACLIGAAGEIPVIGRPLDNIETYILDERFEPVAVGIDGELFIGGAGVARGYVHQPALTADRFLPNPFATFAGGRLYRTGDRARWLSGGLIEYRGRIDRQVKISGYRVEPAEIEAALLRHPGVQAAAVAPLVAPEGRPRLAAYVVTATGAMPDDADLRATLRQRLPEFMLPDRIARLEQLPLTPNAKVDYRALAALAQALPRRRTPVAPRNELERTLAEVWRSVLQSEDPIGIDDNFFDVGGHSLLLVQLHARLRETLGREFAMVDLFRRPSIASFAAFLSEGADPAWSRAGIAARAERQRQASREHQGWRSKER
jgi:amino acid adenylation domain-containing protein